MLLIARVSEFTSLFFMERVNEMENKRNTGITLLMIVSMLMVDAFIIALYSLCTIIEITRLFVFDKLGIFKITKKIYSKYQKIIMTFD